MARHKKTENEPVAIHVNIPIAEYMSSLKPYQTEYLTARAKYRVLMWHRGSHKTTDILNFQLTECYRKKGLYWFISPYLNQGVSTVWTDPNTSIFRWIPEEAKKTLKINNSEHSITFPNGSVWQLKGADKPDSLRGPKPIGIAVDEYGEIAKRWGSELREAVLEPTIRSSKGWIDYAGTPKGNNDFEFIRQLGAKHDNFLWWSSKKTVEDTGMFTQLEMKDIRKNATREEIVDQEYYCKVVDGALTVFKGHYKCINGKLEEPVAQHRYVFGIDLAKSFDRTAIVGFDSHTNHMVYYQLIQNESWELQKRQITSILNKYNNATAVVDATGVGDPFVEQLSNAGLSIYAFKITGNAVKRSLIEKMAMFLENKYISYPDIEAIKDELNNFEFEVTANNNITYSAPSGKHDDIVLAIALAIQQLSMTPEPFKEFTYYDEVKGRMEIDERTGYLR